MTFEAWLIIFFTCMLGAMSPGPSLMCIMQLGLKKGAFEGIVGACAHGVGVAIWALLTIAGVSTIVIAAPAVHQLMIWLGAFYLIYLGALSVRAGYRMPKKASADQTIESSLNPLIQGFLIAFLNPKLALFFMALFSQFVTPMLTNTEKVIMVVTAGAVDAVWYIFVSLIITLPKIKKALMNRLNLIELVGGVVFIIVAIRVILTSL